MLEMEPAFEVAIVGGGPAGLTAGLYAARALRRTVMFERNVTGGQIALTSLVENYPGFADGVNGFELARQMEKQARRQGLHVRYDNVTGLAAVDGGFVLETEAGAVRAAAVIATAGAAYRRLGVPGEERLTGHGVSYCATCDAAFFRGRDVVVVGGGDAALDEGLFVARYAARVYLVHRRNVLRAGRVLQQRAFAEPRFQFIWDTIVERIEGDQEVEAVRLRNLMSGETRRLDVSGVFIFIGQQPANSLLNGLAQLDAGGHALVDAWMRTSTRGLFVAGDLRSQSSRQVISAAGDGATAAIAADQYLSDDPVVISEV